MDSTRPLKGMLWYLILSHRYQNFEFCKVRPPWFTIVSHRYSIRLRFGGQVISSLLWWSPLLLIVVDFLSTIGPPAGFKTHSTVSSIFLPLQSPSSLANRGLRSFIYPGLSICPCATVGPSVLSIAIQSDCLILDLSLWAPCCQSRNFHGLFYYINPLFFL